jgi:hypothetical protein
MRRLLGKLNLIIIALSMTGCMGSTSSYRVDPTLRHPKPLGDYWESTGVVGADGNVSWVFLVWWVPLLILGILIAIRMFKKEAVHDE